MCLSWRIEHEAVRTCRPLSIFAQRSPLRDLDTVRVLGPPLVDVGLQVADRRADREVSRTLAGIPEPFQVAAHNDHADGHSARSFPA